MDTQSISDIRSAITGNPLVHIVKDTADALVFLMAERMHFEGSIDEPLNVLVDLLQFTFVVEGDTIIEDHKESVGVFGFTGDDLAAYPNLDPLLVALNTAAIAKYLTPPLPVPPVDPAYPFNPADDLPPPNVPI